MFLAAYAALNPFGPRQDTTHAGVIASVTAAAWGGRVTPEQAFPSLRRRGRAAGGGARAAMLALCPAVTPHRA